MPKNLLLEKISHEEMVDHMKDLYKHLLKELPKIDRKPKIVLEKDKKNAEDFFGKTGFYDPKTDEIHLFITDRHPKDVLRSFAHEMVHHEQNCSGYTATVDMSKTHEADYASKDPKLREAERDAFERGNMIFRDWTDSIKAKRKKGDKNMNEAKLKEVIRQMIQEITSKGGEKARRAKDPMAYKPPPESKKKSMKYEPHSKEDPIKGKKGQTWGDVVGHSEKPKKVSEVSYEKSGLEHPEKADLNKDKDLSSYELKRGKAIQKSMSGKKDPVKEAEMMARKEARTRMEKHTGKDLKRMKEAPAEATEKLAESRQIGGIVELKPVTDIQHPYPHLFDKKERALKNAFEQKDEKIYNELMKRFGFGKKDGDK